MSLSNPTNTIKNPAEKYLSWHGKKAHLYYYDKEKNENIKIAIPFKMIVLDQLSCVGGFHKATSSNIWSNQVRNPKTDKVFVKTQKGGYSWEGIYKEIINDIPGGRFYKSIYVAIRFPGTEGFILANLKLHGSAAWAWSDFCKKNKEHVEKVGSVCISGFVASDGALEYVIPVFQTVEMKETSTLEQAVELDKKLQAYLTEYFKQNPGSSSSEQEEQESEMDIPEDGYISPSNDAVDDLPF